jgi:hypothetical protein
MRDCLGMMVLRALLDQRGRMSFCGRSKSIQERDRALNAGDSSGDATEPIAPGVHGAIGIYLPLSQGPAIGFMAGWISSIGRGISSLPISLGRSLGFGGRSALARARIAFAGSGSWLATIDFDAVEFAIGGLGEGRLLHLLAGSQLVPVALRRPRNAMAVADFGKSHVRYARVAGDIAQRLRPCEIVELPPSEDYRFAQPNAQGFM